MPPFASLAPLLALALLAPLPGRVDDAIQHEGAYGPEPVGGGIVGRESVIELERVQLAIYLDRDVADVDATYTFRNTLPRTVAYQQVGFPEPAEAWVMHPRRPRPAPRPADGNRPLALDVLLVDGRPAASRDARGYVHLDAEGAGWRAGGRRNGVPMAWQALRLAFPPGRPVTIERRFRAPLGTSALGLSFFRFLLGNGTVWQGPIGRLDAEVTLRGGLTTSDLVWPGERIPPSLGAGIYPDAQVTRPERSAWTLADPTHLRLQWTAFEPGQDPDRAGLALFLRDRPGATP